ncbi:Glutamyl-tRNA(Gln) amidotransferase subunit A [Fusarium albosuccineum]|uniref:Glutamyl-tRNA(Gln) amidotransferase subunit A n=1 Tax=Fusarium albosuccineum TaxID=1237068 RepID=A0A8H4LCN0_9HYPO|nr:Glutamyl-tRNA(Gln) amidotransferase subunit A [Fusarium albosuccineum]
MASLLVQLGLFYLATASASLVSRQIQLGENEYFLPPTSSWKLKSWDSDGFKDEFTPLTVVQLKDTANAERVAAALEQYNKTDDVWTPSFAQVLYIEGSGSAKWLKDLPSEYNASAVVYSDESAAPGPYFVQTATGDVFQAYRLYPDTNQAFIQSSYQDPDGTHHPLRAASFSAGGLTVAVPSRLYYTPTKDKPLAGVRIGVKDLYDLKGLKTSGGNRALYEMSNVKNETAFAVQKLIDAGAIIVGKNKLSEFAFAGPYVPEHIDYLLPFNPRGDGYQSPGDSSGGSAAAAASYDWLDASMGSDTGGSIRGPAANNGAHGNRPTWGAVDLTGALLLSTAMDTSGMIARDPVVWSKINRALYAGTIKEYKLLPENIFLDPNSKQGLSELAEEAPEIVTAAENFLNSLSKILSANVTTFSIDKAWSRSAPDTFKTAPISGLTGAIYGNLTRYEQWTEFGKGYVEEYMDSHNGEFPHMTWGTRDGWLTANRTMTEETHKQDLKIKKVVQDWVGSHFLTSENDTCSNAVYVYFNVQNENYKPDVSTDPSNPWIGDLNNQIAQQRQTILELEMTINCNTTLGSEKACEESIAALEPADGPPDNVSPGRLASVAGLPDYAITLGSFDRGEATFSNSTLKTQMLPLGVDIVAARGCDFMILDIVEELHREGAIKKVNAGSSVV